MFMFSRLSRKMSSKEDDLVMYVVHKARDKRDLRCELIFDIETCV